MSLLFVLGFILLTWVVVYFTPKLWWWTGAVFLYLLATYYLGYKHLLVWYIFAFLAALIAIFFNLAPLRRILSARIYAFAKTILPHISETEALALNAGGCWFEKEIFQGKPDFNLLHASRKFELTPDEQSFLDNETNQLCAMLDDWEINHANRDLPPDVWQFIRNNGFFGLVIAKEYGGKGFSACAHSEIVLKIATKSTTAAVTVMVPNSLGPGELLHNYGTKAQKEYYLPRLASGVEIPCFALTGPTAGSDATSIPDEGIVCYGMHEGSKVLGIRLQHVDKRYITLAPVATLIGLAFQLQDPDGLLASTGVEGITCALLPRDHLGLEIGNRLLPLNLSFMNGTIRIKETFIPIEWIIGGQEMAGQGWRMLVECLSIGRSISLPACGTANALLSLVTTSAYSLVREQFNLAIGNFEGVGGVLAKMGGLCYLMNATRQYTVTAVDSGIRPSVASAIAKYHLTEMGRVVVNDAMDIHGGRGIIMGPNNYLGDIYQGIPVGITVEGANIMSRNLLIFGQGIMKCHPYLRQEYEAIASEDGLHAFDQAIFAHFGYLAQNKTRAIFQAFTSGWFTQGYPSKFKRYYQQITRMSSAFSYISEAVLFLFGGELKRKERISARMGDVMSYLYMASSTLKYFKDNGERADDEIFVRWSVEHCLLTAQVALCAVLDNLPKASIGKILKFFLFPYGHPFKQPSDKLEHQLSQSLLSDCATRHAMKQMCFVPDDINDPVGRMEIAFQAALVALPAKEKIKHALHNHLLVRPSMDAVSAMDSTTADVISSSALNSTLEAKTAQAAHVAGIISSDELAALNLSQKYTHEVIQVDEFKPDELGTRNNNWK